MRRISGANTQEHAVVPGDASETDTHTHTHAHLSALKHLLVTESLRARPGCCAIAVFSDVSRGAAAVGRFIRSHSGGCFAAEAKVCDEQLVSVPVRMFDTQVVLAIQALQKE